MFPDNDVHNFKKLQYKKSFYYLNILYFNSKIFYYFNYNLCSKQIGQLIKNF